MSQLIQLLLRQRARRIQRQYGWPTAASLAVLLSLILWKLATVATKFVGVPVGSLWLSWLLMGVITGRDLTWHIRIERLFVFRVPFRRLYLVDLLLGFISFPVLLLALAVLFSGTHAGALGIFVLITLVTRLLVSIIRTVLLRGREFHVGIRATLLTAAAIAVIVVFYALNNLAILWLTALLCGVVDYAIQRDVLRSGMRAARAGAMFGRLQEAFLLGGPSRPSILWRITLLGWLRNRNALLLFLWGTSYGFLYTWFTHATGLSYFLSFAWMVLIFHSYLRGNLFGIDQKGVWFYFLIPLPLRHVLRAKSSTMTLLQGVMVAAVLLPALLRVTAGMTTLFAWACVLGFAASALSASDIAGQLFSVLHPDPIERGSLYSGGMTLGAFIIPVIHVVLALVYFVVAHFAERAGWFFFVGLPLLLAVLRWRALPVWINHLLARDREEILEQLSAVTP